jgi:pyruvate, orthophosphate dikinase
MDEPEDPLFVSVRSGAAVSMPDMMETVLNLGLNGTSVEGLARRTGDERCARDSYRRFIQMFGDILFKMDLDKFEVDLDKFEAELDDLKKERGVEEHTGLGAEHLKGLIDTYSGLQ